MNLNYFKKTIFISKNLRSNKHESKINKNYNWSLKLRLKNCYASFHCEIALSCKSKRNCVYGILVFKHCRVPWFWWSMRSCIQSIFYSFLCIVFVSRYTLSVDVHAMKTSLENILLIFVSETSHACLHFIWIRGWSTTYFLDHPRHEQWTGVSVTID